MSELSEQAESRLRAIASGAGRHVADDATEELLEAGLIFSGREGMWALSRSGVALTRKPQVGECWRVIQGGGLGERLWITATPDPDDASAAPTVVMVSTEGKRGMRPVALDSRWGTSIVPDEIADGLVEERLAKSELESDEKMSRDSTAANIANDAAKGLRGEGGHRPEEPPGPGKWTLICRATDTEGELGVEVRLAGIDGSPENRIAVASVPIVSSIEENALTTVEGYTGELYRQAFSVEADRVVAAWLPYWSEKDEEDVAKAEMTEPEEESN